MVRRSTCSETTSADSTKLTDERSVARASRNVRVVAWVSHKSEELCGAHNRPSRRARAQRESTKAGREASLFGVFLDQAPPRASVRCDAATTHRGTPNLVRHPHEQAKLSPPSSKEGGVS